MIVPVHMLAFGQYGDVRNVEIPDPEDCIDTADSSRLKAAFYWGQNEHQEQEMRSVSMGDVADLWGRYWLCVSVGWRELGRDEWLNYLGMNHMERMAYYMKEPASAQ